ncbi:hypothetical protein C923_01330 [Plasmodium falciparum UGT5.1]|uniref:Duffy-binding-like domain-containing protein n=1 Tax=Plasmodium falciparum UGT5.1 TaxID=1237627 RepID=W7JSZ5_PLAFA|nr:hypothetical protein C923_01330 [Plasmodium falciparum UGT5.1]
MIGKDVLDKVKNGDAKTYIEELEGNLYTASGSGGELAAFPVPCGLIKGKHKNLIGDRGHPCGKDGTGKEHRFSKERVDEYDEKKIGCSNSEGACAPYRRLSLCNKNFQKINNYSSNAKHNLLLDVCLAAKHEGQSITRDYPKYRATYVDSPYQLCTVLARSFADIGDIVRGRDLYSGNKKKKLNGKETERENLEKNFKKYFQQIYNDVTRTSTSGNNKDTLQERYKEDPNNNFFQLREDWWTANRETVWKAITCDDDKKLASASYFRETCSNGRSETNNNCRCAAGDVPTYFDYVPQFLRWFEEWAEDFCTKRKHKLENAITNCRGHYYGKPRYCSRNGCDCEQTIYKKGYFVIDKGCINCLYACNPYVDWIDKKKEEFEKQRSKYTEEMEKYENGAPRSSGRNRKKRDARNENYDGYEKKFYKILESNGYVDDDKFLDLLSKEDVCTKELKDDDEEEGKIDFKEVNSASGDGNNKTFSHTEYCKPCPDCGVQRNSSGWEKKDTNRCTRGNLYTPKPNKKGTTITILKSGEGHEDIKKKLNAFCAETNSSSGGAVNAVGGSGSQDLYDRWQCYKGEDVMKAEDDDEKDVQKVKDAGGLCILENNDGEGKVNKQKTFNNFFYYWVAHMLKDSIYWRMKKLEKCLEKAKKGKCRNGCKGDCDCFKNWIGKKETEWTNIKKHFGNQEAFKNKVENSEYKMLGPLFNTPDFVLQCNLQIEFLKGDSEDASAQDTQNSLDSDEKQHLKKMLKEIGVDASGSGDGGMCGIGVASGSGPKNIMDKLIDYERGEAKTCLETHKEKCEDTPGAPGAGAGRSDTGPPQQPALHGATDDENEEEDEEEEEEEGDTGPTAVDQVEVEDEKEPQQEASPAQDEVKPACKIVDDLFTSDDNTALNEACRQKYEKGKERFTQWYCASKSGDNTGSSGATAGSGSICIPPRRRKLYIHKVDDDVKDDASLRDWFVKSAAVETFFLWDRYKEENKPQGGVGAAQALQLPGSVSGDSDEETPQQQLSRGEIPPDFLRLMFYTLGDYRDICIGDEKVIQMLKDSGDTKIKDISDKIKSVIEKSGSKPSGQTTKPEDWWNDTLGPAVWNGMICALTYDTNSGGEGKPQQNESVKKAFFGENNNDNPVKPGTFKIKYEYKNAKLEGEGGTTALSSDAPQDAATSTGTTLASFITRPVYFRYLEEWGETFCRERRRRLKDIKYECRGDGNKYSSGDGEECKEIGKKNDTNFKPFDYSSCPKSCTSYKKWIKRKKDEYDEQKSAYVKQKEGVERNNDAKNNSDDTSDNYFVKKLGTDYRSIESFLEQLKKGSCKKDNAENEKKEDGYIDFSNTKETFGHENYCDPCPVFGVKCINGVCNGGGTKVTCNGETVTAEEVAKMKDSTVLNMLVSDKSATTFPSGLEACKNANIFKGFRKDEWTCGNLCKSDVCVLKNFNQDIHEKQNVLIRTLFIQWLEHFLKDYIEIQKKLKPCIENGKGKEQKCFKGCKENCDCVKEWVAQKTTEWEKIKKRYLDQYKNAGGSDDYNVKYFLQQAPFHDEVNKAIKPCTDLNKFQDSTYCTETDSSEKKKGEKRKDIVECLLDRLKKKATSCPGKPSSEKQSECKEPPHDDEQEPLEEENTVEAPKICPPTKQQPEPDDKCGEIEEKKDEKEEEPKGEDGGAIGPSGPAGTVEPEQEPPKPQSPKAEKKKTKPKRSPRPIDDLTPALKKAMLSSTIMWSIGIGFAAFTYFFLKNEKKKKKKRNIKKNLLKYKYKF